jgi:hypothetical protein
MQDQDYACCRALVTQQGAASDQSAAQEQESMALELSREALAAIVGGMMPQKWLMDMTPY